MTAIFDEIVQILKKSGIAPAHREGTAESGWLLLDYMDVIVHIFAPAERVYYNLDEMWREARPVVRIE